MLSIMDIQANPFLQDPSIRMGADAHRKTVLLVEGQPALRRLIDHQLTALGYRVLTGVDPANPAFQARLRIADIVLVSFHWNRGSGWDLFNRLKAKNTALPVLLYTMEDSPSLGVKAIAEALAEVFNPCPQQWVAS